jgi:molecular chaperone GrpE
MSRKKKKDQPREDADSSTMAEEQQPAEAPTLEQQVETLRDENLRLTAELRNVAQRAQRERQEALRFAEADFAKELLAVLDDLERTLESVKTVEDLQTVTEGVRIVYDHFQKVLQGRGIEAIEAKEQPFDPHLHEALMQQPSEDHPTGIVLQEFLRGYKMHGRVIRPTKVAVSSGSPTTPDEQTSGQEKEENDADV